ncbi:multisubunit Na+/H+ antiporter MnhB subunit [Scopulibacillus daqui]|uniref:Multisubunit Na+/H+ antiporter MnhB subunit n=1 Tax=Scopulibacillus daqui TaxID=1469162 RepID=A0ABS2PVJ7_9BACL|nr:hypothetical protein [Scopulibacillus daqui]MBM7643988.1 multisubunit Na+/H+ antiporter MnhB subunit [Scopulibacillus daqui]
MKLMYAAGITLIVVLMTLYEWPKLKQANKKKEKTAYTIITLIGWVCAVLLVYFPDMPGPTQVVNFFFMPISKWLGL